MNEIWKKIEDFPTYEVSNFGNIKRIGKEVFLKYVKVKGHQTNKVVLSRGLCKNKVAVSEIVYKTFIGCINNNEIVVIKDHNKFNCKVNNLLQRKWSDLLDSNYVHYT